MEFWLHSFTKPQSLDESKWLSYKIYNILSKFHEILQYLYEWFAIVDDSLLSSSLYILRCRENMDNTQVIENSYFIYCKFENAHGNLINANIHKGLLR